MAYTSSKPGPPGTPKNTRPDQETEAEREIREHCQQRISRAEQDRNRHQKRISDCYKLALPWRHKFNEEIHADTLDDIFDSTAMTTVEDFAADMLNTFTPMKADWVDIVPVETMDVGALNQLRAPLQKYKKVLFDEIRRSNLDSGLQESYLDLAVGTMALVVQDRHPSEPIHCMAITISDLLIDRGPWGEIDGRWRRMKLKQSDIETMWPDAKKIGELDSKTSEGAIEITDGVYRDWSDRGTERWKYVVFSASRLLLNQDYTGRGSCPYVVARWSRDSKTAWGIGPTYRELPNIKTLNHVRYLELKSLDKNVDPPVSYENDGVINVDNGVNPGDWIPRELGSQAPEVIEAKNKFEVAFIKAEDLIAAIKRAHYQDEPEQVGKTPPSATQWMDSAARKARRMGTPATNLVHDLQYPIINRFAYLLAKRGILPKVELNGKEIALQPVSPLLRAQEQEEVVRVDRFLEMAGARFGPEMVNLWVKQDDTLQWLADKMGVPKDLIRTQAEMQAVAKTIGPLIGRATGLGNAPAQNGAASQPAIAA